MPIELDLADNEIAPLIGRLTAECSLFRGIDPNALGDVLRLAGRRLRLDPGEDLVVEGESADAIYFVESGGFEVRKRSEQGADPADGGHRIGQMGPGALVGEVALLDRGTRSATVRALEASVVLMLRVRDLEPQAATPHPAVQMQLNLAHELAQKIRHSTSSAVRHLEEALHEERKRVEMGRFMSRVLIGTCLYMFALVLMQPLKTLVPDSTAFSVVVLLGFAFGLWMNIRTSMFPASAYGFTLAHWGPALREALLFSLPFLALIVALKWVLLQTSPAFDGLRLFDLYRHTGLGTGGTLLVVLAYALFVPVQEMVARSGIQSSLMMFLRPKHRVPMSIFMSTLLFSSTHLHTSFEFAVLVFPMGLFWGWLYSRHPTLVGVVFSHLLIGIWAVFVVSFPFF
jgi:CRP-like cAMP-binding protein/membrane protease YdiL (CAAX protease family)